MAVTNGYCAVTDIRDHLGDAGAKLDQDLIERAISTASRSIDRFCGRRFWKDATPVARLFRPRNDDFVIVNDIATATGLLVATDDGDGTYATSWTIDTDFILEPNNADIAEDGAHPWWIVQSTGARLFPVDTLRPSLRVTAVWGWSAIPDDVVEATILLAVRTLRLKDAPFGVFGDSQMGAMRVLRMDPATRVLVQPYVRMAKGDW